MENPDNLFMLRALELARLGQGTVSPNPLVGCVVVHEGRVIGEGWHQQYGEAHAEVNAIAAVQDPGLLRESTVYVNLEPCSHHGKTPPCADLLIERAVKKVVVANLDPNPLVNGRGIQKLQNAGIEVVIGMEEAKGRALNKRFFTAQEKKRPYIIFKWAQTSDGFMARENYDSKWISGEDSRKLVHKWRTEEDAVLVGTSTAKYDDPQLNVRDWAGRDPVRVVIDKELSLKNSLKLFDGSQSTICYNTLKDEGQENLIFKKISEKNVLTEMLADLYDQGLHSVIVEGGASTIYSFIRAGLWDEARVFVAPKKFEKGVRAPVIEGSPVGEEIIKEDKLLLYIPKELSKGMA